MADLGAESGIDWEVVMKSTTMEWVRWTGMAGLVLACGMLAGGAVAQTQNTLNFGHTLGGQTDQQPSPSASSAELPVVTPELRADMLVAHGQYKEAIEAYRKIQPQTAELYNKIGIAYQHLAMDQAAMENYDRAFHMDHKLAAAYNNLGTVYYHENDNKRAKRLYKKSIKLDAQTAPFWSNLGAVYLAQKQYSDGAEAYERAFTLDPNIFQEIALNGFRQDESPQELAKMYLCFAEIYAHAGMKTEAIDYLRKALHEGFKDTQKLQQDQQFASLRGTPEFEQLVSDHKQQ
jgi:tetratricopeptide (TPR) repeat protein